jgi:hypothetical protein
MECPTSTWNFPLRPGKTTSGWVSPARNGISQWENQVELVSSNRGGIFQVEVGCEKRKWDAKKGRGRGRGSGRGGACVCGRRWQAVERDGTLTVGLDHLGPARATKDHDASALLDSGVGVIIILPTVSTSQAASIMPENSQYTERRHTAFPSRCLCPHGGS